MYYLSTTSSQTTSSSKSAFVGLFLFLCIPVSIVVLALLYQRKKEKKLREALLLYASSHGFQFLPGDQGEMQDGGAFSNGKISNVISGGLPQSKNDFRQYYQTEVRGSGKNRRVYYRTILVADCPDTLTRFILNSKLNVNQSESSAFGLFDSSQKIKLEGNFSDFYDVYSPTGEESNLLTLLSPDVMEFILTKCARYDIEILGGKLFMYAYPHITSEKREEMIDLFDQLAAQLVLKKGDARPAYNAVAGGQNMVARIADQSQVRTKIKMSKWKAILAAGIFVPIVLVNMLSSSSIFRTKSGVSVGTIVFIVFTMTIVIFSFVMVLKQKMLKNKYKQYVESVNKDKKL